MPPNGSTNVISHIEVLEQLTEKLVNSPQVTSTYLDVLDAVPVGIGLFTSRICMWMNHFGCRLFGYDHCSELIGKNSLILYSTRDEYERIGKAIYPFGITVAKVKKYDGSERQVIVRILKSDIETGKALVLFYSCEDMEYLCRHLHNCKGPDNSGEQL